MTKELCHCGLPLHYRDAATEAQVNALIDRLGKFAEVRVMGRSFLVPRHYIALHGLKGWEVPLLGFAEITGQRRGTA